MRANEKVFHITVLKDITEPSLSLNNQTLQVVKSCKYLGVDINTELNWTQ